MYILYGTIEIFIPSSTIATTTPDPVMPCIQAGSTFRSLPDGPRVMVPVFNCNLITSRSKSVMILNWLIDIVY